MPSFRKRDIYEKSTIRDKKIKISTTSQSLRKKIHLNITNDFDKIYWYIKFNIQLDPNTVNKKTMRVTETNGYILDTFISYDLGNNVIAINPRDIYMPNEYYILSISKKVKSQKGQKLKKEIYIMFKLIGNQISEFELLKSTANVPKPKPRTNKYRKELANRIAISKVYSFDNSIYEDLPQDKLPYENIKINFLIGLLGIILSIGGVYFHIINVIIVGLLICFVGALHIIAQLLDKHKKSNIYYNIGVMLFNASKYVSAEKFFKKAINISIDNEMAEYALNKTQFYK